MPHPDLRRLLVLGTGTDVGKTWVTVHLARALAERSTAPVLAVKPVETDVDPTRRQSDSARLDSASNRRVEPNPLYAFPEPLSPHLAARQHGLELSISRFTQWIQDVTLPYVAIPSAWLLIETAGGALSPLSPHATNLDLARALEPAVLVLVAPDRLGVLHDVTVTLDAFRLRHRPPDHLLLTAAPPHDASTGTNAAELTRLGIATPFATCHADDPAPLQSLARALSSVA